MIIDTHCHLDDVRYKDDLDEVMKRSFSKGVGGVLIPGADISDLERAKHIADTYENVYYAAGVHPYHHEQYDEKILRAFLQDPKCIAVGECGLDYYRLPEELHEKEEEIRAQKEVFAQHIRLAKELKKPLIVHIREANDDSRTLLLQENAGEVGGVLHCYNASKHLLDLAEHGFYFGIGGVVTFKNARALVEVLPFIPPSKLLIETDGPYLTPMPYRGERNEPSYTILVAEKMAEILKMPVTQLHELTTKNAFSLFKAFEKSSLDKI